jgi:hypothetical protein
MLQARHNNHCVGWMKKRGNHSPLIKITGMKHASAIPLILRRNRIVSWYFIH